MNVTAAPIVRDLGPSDLECVVELDRRLTGEAKRDYWTEVVGRLADDADDADGRRLGLAVELDGRVVGYLFGEIRAFEFGSKPCGWILVIGVDPDHARERIATRLLAHARRRFRSAGVDTLRTMVGRTDVPMLSFFRASGFAAGAFVQLELGIEGDA